MKVTAVFILCLLGITSGFEDKTVVEWLVDNGGFSTLVKAVTEAGLVQDLSSSGPFTVFAPTDAAFNRLGTSIINELLSNKNQLKLILEYHVLNEYVLVPMIRNSDKKATLEGGELSIIPIYGGLLINSVANVSAGYQDIVVNNGVIQPINSILMPPTLPVFTINQYLMVHDARFKDLVLALVLADLTTSLDVGDFTLFAPVDSAFGIHQNDLLNPTQANLKAVYAEILKYHVVPGARLSSDLQNGQTLYTLQGNPITVNIGSAGVSVSGAKVLTADLMCTNGVIHAIDDIMVPPNLNQITQG